MAIIGGGGSSEHRWKPLSDLPSPGKAETHERDSLYGRLVAERPVMEPVDFAVRFLVSLA
jgi:hypothetical protein